VNKKIIVILILTAGALAVLTLFSFGPLAGWRKRAAINPASQVPQGGQQATVQNRPVRFNNFINRDVRENYYTFNAPDDWQVKSGPKPGSYIFSFPGGAGGLSLMDVPDNSTLELFILSQQEPQLKKASPDYVRRSYKKPTQNNTEAYELTFSSMDNGRQIITGKTYFAGPDNAAVFSFITDKSAWPGLSPVFTVMTGSFGWRNKP